jgi:hypothetical protein
MPESSLKLLDAWYFDGLPLADMSVRFQLAKSTISIKRKKAERILKHKIVKAEMVTDDKHID